MLLQFNTHQHACYAGDATWVDSIYVYNSAYGLTTPVITTQSVSNPGIIEIGVYKTED